jgi:hypothetical protein
MKPILLFTLLFCTAAEAQESMRYAAFTDTDTSVRWAAESDKIICLMPRSINSSLNRIYRSRLAKGQLQSWAASQDLSVQQEPVTATDLRQRRRPEPVSNRDARSQLERQLRPFLDTTALAPLFDDTSTRSDLELFRVRQLVYYRKGRFYVDNILVTPLSRERDSAGNAWYSYFSTSFRKPSPNAVLPAQPAKGWIYLGTSTVNYHLNLSAMGRCPVSAS